MEAEYCKYINDLGNAYGQCHTESKCMAKQFPELKLTRGHYYDDIWGRREHWWLTADDGSIVDPTANQFPTRGQGVYYPWIEGAKEPTGKCVNCGEYVYDDQHVHPECYDDFIGSLTGDR